MHFHHLTLLPPEALDWPADQIVQRCEVMMQPFDESREVAPYKVWLDPDEILRMATAYDLDARDLGTLCTRMEDWNGGSGGLDARGLYYETTRNPYGRWDWWVIGGRWDGWLRAPQTGARNMCRVARNMCRVSDLPPEVTCWSLLLPDGTWHEEGWPYDRCPSYEAYRTLSDAERLALTARVEQEWRSRCAEMLSAHPTHVAVSCDIHR